MKRLIAVLVAALTIGVFAAPATADAAVTGCSSWSIYEGSTGQYGRAGYCSTYSGSGYNRWRLRIVCTNGSVLYTPWSAAGGWSYGKFCPYPSVVSSWNFQFGTAG